MVVPALGLLFAAAPLPADEVELFGYFESQFMGARLVGDFHQVFANKLRVDLQSKLSDRVAFGANFNAVTYHGRTLWNILDYLVDDVTAPVPSALRPLYSLEFSDRSWLDNAWMKLSFPAFDLTVGRQQISMGTGYVWNPTDVFNVKDMLDPTYEQPGHNAVRLDIPLSPSSSATLFYSPEADWSSSARMARFKSRLGRFDFELTAVARDWIFPDFTRFDPAAGAFAGAPQSRRLIGGATAGELLGLGVWAEFAWNDMSAGKDFSELVAGADFTFDFQTYVMVEYYRNSLGKTGFRDYDLNDWMRYFTAVQKAVTRDQLYVLARHPVSDLVDLGLFGVAGLSDGSVTLAPTLQASLSDDVEVFAYLNINIGRKGAVFGSNQGQGALLRARIYF